MKINTLPTFVSSLIVSTLSFSACGEKEDSDESLDSAESALDSTEQAEQESQIIASSVSGVSFLAPPQSAEQAATAIAARLQQRYTPTDCIAVVQSATTITATLDQCTGPWGLRQLSGSMTLEVSLNAQQQVVIDTVADGITSRGASFDFTANAIYTAAADSKSVVVTSSATGTGPRGVDCERTGNYTATWTDTCITMDGSWSLERDFASGTRKRTTTVDVERCINACPNGSTTIESPLGTLTILYDGTATASWSVGAKEGTFPLLCGVQ